MEDHLVFQFMNHIFQYYKPPVDGRNRYIIFEKEKFRHKGDISILRRPLQMDQNSVDLLLIESEKWCFPLREAKLSSEFLHLFLKKENVFKRTIDQVLNKRSSYGSCPANKKLIIKEDNDIKNPLTKYRIHLAVKLVSNLDKKLRSQINPDSEENKECLQKFYFTNRSEILSGGYEKVYVMGIENGKKKSELTLEEYLGLKKLEISNMSSDMNSKSTSSEDLVSASVKFELFHGSLSSPARLSEIGEISHNTKDAIFVIYNYVRLKVLLNTFESKVKDNIYPELPNIDTVDFSLLTKEEEWSLLLDHILRFPQLVTEFFDKFDQGKVLLHPFFIMLVVFSNQLSRYYRRIRILTEPKHHLVQIMFARIYLISACVEIYDILFDCLDIKPPAVM